MSVLDDLLEAKEPELRRCEFCLVHDLREQWTKAKTKAGAARTAADARGSRDANVVAELEAAEQELDDLREQIGQHLVVFQFRSIDRVEFDRIKKENRPTEQQRTEARKAGTNPPEWNTDTFAPALVAAACVTVTGPSGTQPGLSTEDAVKLWASDRWNEAERAELFHTALAAYVSRTDMEGVTLGNGSGRTPAS